MDIKAIVQLMRPGTALSGVGATVLGGYVAKPDDWWPVFFAALVVFCIQASGNIANDISDEEIDRINKPWRAIPSGRVSSGQAVFLGALLATLGVLIAFFQNKYFLILVIPVFGLLLIYAASLKCVPVISNLIVAWASAMTSIYGAWAGGNWQAGVPLAGVIFVGILAREVLKDLADREGDSQLGCKTTVVVYGVKKSLLLFELLAVVTLLGVVSLSWVFGDWYRLISLWVIGGIGFIMMAALYSQQQNHLERLNGVFKFFFFIWFLAVFIGAR